jgi:hypothetical protein
VPVVPSKQITSSDGCARTAYQDPLDYPLRNSLVVDRCIRYVTCDQVGHDDLFATALAFASGLHETIDINT